MKRNLKLNPLSLSLSLSLPPARTTHGSHDLHFRFDKLKRLGGSRRLIRGLRVRNNDRCGIYNWVIISRSQHAESVLRTNGVCLFKSVNAARGGSINIQRRRVVDRLKCRRRVTGQVFLFRFTKGRNIRLYLWVQSCGRLIDQRRSFDKWRLRGKRERPRPSTWGPHEVGIKLLPVT